MKRNLLIKGFVLPLALGLVFGVAFFFLCFIIFDELRRESRRRDCVF